MAGFHIRRHAQEILLPSRRTVHVEADKVMPSLKRDPQQPSLAARSRSISATIARDCLTNASASALLRSTYRSTDTGTEIGLISSSALSGAPQMATTALWAAAVNLRHRTAPSTFFRSPGHLRRLARRLPELAPQRWWGLSRENVADGLLLADQHAPRLEISFSRFTSFEQASNSASPPRRPHFELQFKI